MPKDRQSAAVIRIVCEARSLLTRAGGTFRIADSPPSLGPVRCLGASHVRPVRSSRPVRPGLRQRRHRHAGDAAVSASQGIHGQGPHLVAWRSTSRCGTRPKDDPEKFWGELGKELHWFKPFTKVLEWNEPFAKWFVGGQDERLATTASTCTSTRRGANKAAIIWEGEPGDQRRLHLPDAAPRSLQVRQRA